MMARWALAWCVLFTAGCATGPTSSPLLVSASAGQYEVPAVAQVLATNQSDRPLYLFPCIQVQQQSTTGSWVSEANGGCSSTTVLLRVAPGATDSALSATFFTSGTWRVGVSYGTDSSGARSGESFSNSFAVVQ